MTFSLRDKTFIKNPTIWLIAIFVLGLLIRLWLLPNRWINPDEGAHLMDARLALEGKIPIVDYSSRQPFYVFVLALFLKTFGVSYKIGRLVPLLSNLGIGFFIYLIGRKLFDRKVALLASGMFVFFPLSVIWSTVVKTEPLAIFLGSVSMYFVVSFLKSSKHQHAQLYFAGFLAALAFYVRQTTLSIPVAILLFFLIKYRRDIRVLLKNFGFVLAGYLSVCILVNLFFLQYMNFTRAFFSQLNPLNIVIRKLGSIFFYQSVSVEEGGFRILDQAMDVTIGNLKQTFNFTSFLIIGLIISIGILIFDSKKKRTQENTDKVPFYLLYSWIFSVVIFYAYQIINRGFFSQYFTELFPPMVLIFSWVVFYLLNNKNFAQSVLLGGLSLYLVIFLVQHKFWYRYPGKDFYFLFSVVLIGLWWFPRFFKDRSHFLSIVSFTAGAGLVIIIRGGLLHPLIGDTYSFTAGIVLFLTFVYIWQRFPICQYLRNYWSLAGLWTILLFALLSAAISGVWMGPSYDCVWSPATVRQGVDVLKNDSAENDVILSGAMIWPFESGRKTFLDISHPTLFLLTEFTQFNYYVENSPPRYIIFDGYTEKKYSQHFEFLRSWTKDYYHQIQELKGSRCPVKIYKLKSDE